MDRRYFLKAAGTVAALAVSPSIIRRAFAQTGEGGEAVIPSPGGRLTARLFVDGAGRLSYELKKGESFVIEPSPLGVIANNEDLGMNVRLGLPVQIENRKGEAKTRGNHTEAVEKCSALVLPVLGAAQTKLAVELRVFDDGLAWRYHLTPGVKAVISGEASAFKLPAGTVVFMQSDTRNYEGVHEKRRIEEVAGLAAGMPVTAVLPGGGFAAFTEAALFGYSGMTLAGDTGNTFRSAFLDDKTWSGRPGPDGLVKSPWRVVLSSDDLNGLVNSDVIFNLNDPPDPELFADADKWIKPGRALWSWWSEGTGTFEMQKKYIDAAQKMGFEYILVDEGWEFWMKLGQGKWDLIRALCDYGRPKGVAVWIWKRHTQIKREARREDFFKRAAGAGVAGLKIDFMDSESRAMNDFYEACLKLGARHKLMINFHGANKPTGEPRPYPNEMTREGIRGLEYNKWTAGLSPAYNATLPFTRFLAGHGDYTPVTFNPSKIGETTFAHQLACAVVFLSPVTHWADKPENYLDNPASAPALDVIKSMPTAWDETIVLPRSEIGKCAAFARRKAETWFIGVINGGPAGEISITLDFIGRGLKAILLSDRDDTAAGFNREEREVSPGETIAVKMRAGGGFVAWLG